MTAVLIHPTGVHRPDGARNWARTMDQLVDFRTGALAGALSPRDREVLEELHPEGRARFWGTPAHNAHFIARVRQGDVVFLTGRRRGRGGRAQVLGIGRIGLLTENPALGNVLWPPTQESRNYTYVYSLAPFVPSDLTQEELATRGGQGPKPPFLGLRVLPENLARHVLDAFSAEIPAQAGVTARSPGEHQVETALRYDTADTALAADLAQVRVVDVEVLSTDDVTVRAHAAGTMHRGESRLVHDYIAALPPGATWARYTTPVGTTDLDVWHGGVHELVEAKSSAERVYVRQALAQLLDYAPALTRDLPDVLTALFPARPAESAVELLHRYGVDCVFREGTRSYRRLPAPSSAQSALQALWVSERHRGLRRES